MLKISPMRHALAAASALGWALSLTVIPAVAQQPQEQQQDRTPVQIEDRKLRQFADAQRQVARIVEQTSQRVQNAQSAEESQKIQSQAQEEMAQSVVQVGLTVEEYNQIVQAIQTDEGLRQRVEQLQKERQNQR